MAADGDLRAVLMLPRAESDPELAIPTPHASFTRRTINMKLRDKSMITMSLALAGLVGACATATPAQLIEARSAYSSSSAGLAAKLSPTELYDAKKFLDKANLEFDQHGDTNQCRDFAYIAQRKVELADVKARTERDRQKIAEAVKAGIVVRDIQVKSTQVALDSTREQLKQERDDNNAATKELRAENRAQGQELDETTAQLGTERQARMSAEGKLAGAMKDLAAIAAVKEETRGMVITLSGSVLFASGKFALLNTAMIKLDQVAEALKAQDADKHMVVEGHTDAQGSDRVNQTLSLNRGNTVRDYLVSRGVAAGKITAVGLGSSRPIVDNKTPENRANNRRVEIIISATTVGAR
jgi:outer membrane protein OmpA-like peptidoglycan-associated protein